MAVPGADSLANAALQADELAERIRQADDLEPGFAALESGIRELEESGLSVDAVIPATEEEGLGFALRRARSGRSFWTIYSQALRRSLCEEGGALHQLAAKGVSASAGSLVAIVAVLGLPLVALPIITAVAAIIATTGIDAWCEWSKPTADEPTRP